MIEAYPLAWPPGWPRTDYPVWSQFKSPTVASARQLVLRELDRLGATDVIISSNMELNKDGWPAARQRRMTDTGVAVYFMLDGEERCIPADKYHTVEENLHAIGRTIEALRSLERWGTGQIMKAAFRGFTALPPGGDPNSPIYAPAQPWYEVLEVSPTASPEIIRAAFRSKATKAHPDSGGSVEEFNRIKNAHDEGMKVKQ